MHFIKLNHLDFDADLNDKASEGVCNVLERFTDETKRKKRFEKTGDSKYRILDFNKTFEFEAKKQLFGDGDKRYIKNRQTIISITEEQLDEISSPEPVPQINGLDSIEEWLREEKTVIVILMRHKSFVTAVRRIERIKGRKWCYDNAVALHRNYKMLHPEQEKREKYD